MSLGGFRLKIFFISDYAQPGETLVDLKISYRLEFDSYGYEDTDGFGYSEAGGGWAIYDDDRQVILDDDEWWSDSRLFRYKYNIQAEGFGIADLLAAEEIQIFAWTYTFYEGPPIITEDDLGADAYINRGRVEMSFIDNTNVSPGGINVIPLSNSLTFSFIAMSLMGIFVTRKRSL